MGNFFINNISYVMWASENCAMFQEADRRFQIQDIRKKVCAVKKVAQTIVGGGVHCLRSKSDQKSMVEPMQQLKDNYRTVILTWHVSPPVHVTRTNCAIYLLIPLAADVYCKEVAVAADRVTSDKINPEMKTPVGSFMRWRF